MDNRQYISILKRVVGVLNAVIFSLLIIFGMVLYMGYDYLYTNNVQQVTVKTSSEFEIENGVHVQTGLLDGEGLEQVVINCTSCHSSKLITQNRMTKAGWTATIKWMQETQNLWDLGGNEDLIVNYLAKYYAPEEKGRRAQLTNIEWYELD